MILDAPMISASTAPPAVRDEFNAVSFNNNDGSINWESPWVEDDAQGAGPTVGNVDIYNGALCIDDRPNTGTSPSAARDVDLSAGVASATFSFDFLTGPSIEAYEDKVAVEVSADGGTLTQSSKFSKPAMATPLARAAMTSPPIFRLTP